MTELEAAFASVNGEPSDSAATFVRGVEGRPDVFVGASGAGRPIIYIRCVASDRPFHPILLAHLAVAFDVECDLIRTDGKREEGVFGRIEGTSDDEDSRRVLFQAIEPALLALPTPTRASHIENSIKRLSEVFRLMDGSARTTSLGLWGEMFVILQAPAECRRKAIAAWHTDPAWLQDFGLGDSRVEVKTCAQDRRTHTFNLRQLNEGASEILVVSLMTKRTPNGLTIEDLWTQLRAACGGRLDLVEHLDAVVARSLGSGIAQALRMAYDAELAFHSKRVYLADDVPKPGPNVPSEVLEVHFSVDLSLTSASGTASSTSELVSDLGLT